MESRSSDTAIMVSWFYSKRGGISGTSHDSMMRSITYQILVQCPSLFKTFRNSYRQYGLIRDTFATLLLPASVEERFPRIICLLDGLDESEDRDGDMARDILCLLAELTERPGSRLKVLVLSRPYKIIQMVYGTYDILLEAENRADVEKIVESGVDSLSQTINHLASETFTSFGQARRMRLEDDLDNAPKRYSDARDNTVSEHNREAAEAVREYLKENARGVTLWVTLSLQQIIRFASRGPCTWAAVQKLLRRLPLELDQMYDMIVQELMTSCDREHMLMARKVLAWVMTASTRRPLLFRELMDAMSIPDDWETAGIDIDESRDPIRDNRPIFSTWPGLWLSINNICGPLVEFVNPSDVRTFHYDRPSKVTGSSVVQLVHQTAKDFLEKCQHRMFGFRPDEARLLVRDYGIMYLRLVIPLSKAKYAPYLDDVSDDWETTVRDLLQYLDDKHLIPFVLVYCNIHAKDLILAASSDNKDWRLSAFFHDMEYKDLEVDGVVEKTVVGLLYRLGCNLGMDVAVGNLLFLTSLRGGWWRAHRAAVLRAASAAARSCRIRSLRNILTREQYRLTKPARRAALHLGDRDDPQSLYRVIARPPTTYPPDLHNVRKPLRRLLKSRVPELSQVGDVEKVKMAISRVIHYLLGNLQPVELVGVEVYDDMGLALELI